MKRIDDYLDFLILEKGEDILHNGQSNKALISDARDKISFYDDKFLRTDFEIKTGDLIDYQDSKWIVISEVDKNRISYKARIRKSNYKIKIYVDEVLYEFNTIIEGISFDIEEGKYVNLEGGKIKVLLPLDEISNKIDVNMRFIKMGKPWKVIGIDKSKAGLITLYCEKDTFNSNDDIEYEIADRWLYESDDPVEPIEILGSNTIRLNDIKTYTIDVVVTWSVSNGNVEILSQDINSITLKGVTMGSMVLTADDGTNTYTKDITVTNLF